MPFDRPFSQPARQIELGRPTLARPGPHAPTRPPFRIGALSNDTVLFAPDEVPDIALNACRQTPLGLTESELLHCFNTLDWDDLSDLHGVSEMTAHRLIKDRNTFGPFHILDEVVRAPGIGQHRFESLVGRSAFYARLRLSILLRVPPDRVITVRDLQPVAHPPEVFARVFFGPASAESGEKQDATARGFKLVKRRANDWFVYFHQTQLKGPLDAPPRKFLHDLPAVLREIDNRKDLSAPG